MLPKHAERYECDTSGQWWYRVSTTGVRGRASVSTCEQCSTEFLARLPQRFCSPECKGLGLSGPRVERVCQHCGNRITSPHAKKFCSHSCACSARHKAAPVTTVVAADVQLLGADNPRYWQDESGQWWYQGLGAQGAKTRSRASIKTCLHCGGMYLTNVFNTKNSGYCGRTCSAKAHAPLYRDKFKGENGGNWKGGRRVDARGYVLQWAPDHPSPRKVGGRYMFEHRLVMEKMLGRYLEPHEQVHHKNGIRDDNRPENLELWVKQQPPGARVHEQQHCPTCTCFLHSTGATG